MTTDPRTPKPTLDQLAAEIFGHHLVFGDLNDGNRAIVLRVAALFGGVAEEPVEVPMVCAAQRNDQEGFAWVERDPYDGGGIRLTIGQARAVAARSKAWPAVVLRIRSAVESLDGYLAAGDQSAGDLPTGPHLAVLHLKVLADLMTHPQMGRGPR